eukprot:jgi/Chrzof1/9047/Cz03g34050.t1
MPTLTRERCPGSLSSLFILTDRGKGVAKELCRLAWSVEASFACGMVTSHPCAVRALEAATERPVDPQLVKKHAEQLVVLSRIPYVQNCALDFSDNKCLIDTRYFVDHTEVEEVLAKQGNWQLGPLMDGMELVAFTFRETPKSGCVSWRKVTSR